MDQYKAILVHITCASSAASLCEALSASLPLFAVSTLPSVSNTCINSVQRRLQQSAIQEILTEILNTNTQCISSRLSNFTILVEEFAKVIPNCASLRSKILLALSSNELQESIQTFLHYPEPHILCREDEYITANSTALHRKFISATISMLLTSALTSHSSEPGLPHTLAMALLSKQQKLTHTMTCPPNVAPLSVQPSISLFEQGCTPATGRPLQDWRERLRSELESQSF